MSKQFLPPPTLLFPELKTAGTQQKEEEEEAEEKKPPLERRFVKLANDPFLSRIAAAASPPPTTTIPSFNLLGGEGGLSFLSLFCGGGGGRCGKKIW